WPLFGFEFAGKHYAYTVLPFGFSQSPFVFHKVTRQVTAFCRAIGLRMISYLDDFLFASSSRENAVAISEFTTWLFGFLGFNVNHAKSMLDPSQSAEFLGFALNSSSWTLRVSP